MPINVPNNAQGAFTGSMDSGGQKIELPFYAPPFRVMNGNANFEELKNVQFFGGWACSNENIQKAAEQYENCPTPIPSFSLKSVKPEGAKDPVPSHLSRSLVVAPFGMREFSVLEDKATGQKKRVPPFTKGAGPRVQVITMLGYYGEDKKTIHPWAPVMLTASGYQVNHVKKAFQSWRNAIKPFMTEIAPGMPEDVVNLFWMNIGTFGPERHEESHGQSSITPVSVYIPEGLTAAQIETRYVGNDVAEFMAKCNQQSQEWLKAYQQPARTPVANAPGEPVYTNVQSPEDDEPIPF